MKLLLVSTLLVAALLYSCNGRQQSEDSLQNKSDKGAKYFYYDDELTVRSIAKVDTAEFRKVMNSILPPKKIMQLFGSGYQLFYLALDIDISGKTYGIVAPEGGSWITGLAQIDRKLFREDLELAEDHAIVQGDGEEQNAIDLKDIFYMKPRTFGSAFQATAGFLNGTAVRSRKIFQIDLSIDNNANISKPWIIKEIDASLFRPKLKNGLGVENYIGFFPASIRDDYKTLKNKVQFPDSAIKRGVFGKVLVRLFFEADGKYAGYQFLKGLGYGCDDAVIKALNDYPMQSYPTGERSMVVLPFSFGASSKTSVDLTASGIIDQNPKSYNNLYFKWYSKTEVRNPLKVFFKIMIRIDDQIVAASQHRVEYGTGAIWFHYKPAKPGLHKYEINLDPENVLNDADRSNNTVRGEVEIK